MMFLAPLPADTPNEDLSASPPPATGPYMITKSQPGRGWEYERNPEWLGNNAELLPQLPSGHVDAIDVTVVRNPSTQVDDVERGTYHWMQNPPPSGRIAAVRGEYEGEQFRSSSHINVFYFWMNTQQAPFDDVRVRQAVNHAVDSAALERIYAGQLSGLQQVLPVGMPGHEDLELYPHDLAEAKRMIAAADPADREITVWAINVSPNKEAGEYYESVLSEIGFDTTLKIVNADNYFTVTGNLSTPDLDTGWSSWLEDYPHPNDFFEPQLAGASTASTNNTNWSQFDHPAINARIEKLSHEQLGPDQEAEYAALDREVMEEAPWAPYGTLTLSTFVSDDVDFDELVISPVFGADLTSFELE
jgi:peptide/nickel transport system substrate-binding protein